MGNVSKIDQLIIQDVLVVKQYACVTIQYVSRYFSIKLNLFYAENK